MNSAEEALRRLESPRFDLCADCALPIAWDDLVSRPQSQLCRRCESERDRRRALPAR